MMHIETQGTGRDVVLVHGWGLHGGVWHDLATRLAAGHRVSVPDLPGHGRSPPVDEAFTLERLAESLARRVAAPAAWIGWSLGAWVALTAARKFPETVSRLVLIGATPRFIQDRDWPHAVAADTLDGFARELETDYDGTLQRFLSLQAGTGETGRATVRRLRAAFARHSAPTVPALRAGLRLLAETDLRPQLGEINAPALVVHGGRDRLTPPGAGAYLAAHLPDARLVTIPGAGHAPFLSHPEPTWQALADFLAAPAAHRRSRA
jgi:pimeloyl-[acyl-carrier protein] methyl ester esterase